jgi:hypothetical protein
MREELGPQQSPRRVQLSETSGFRQEGFEGHVYVAPEEGIGFNVLSIDVYGNHPRKRMLGDTTRMYYVIGVQALLRLMILLPKFKQVTYVLFPLAVSMNTAEECSY